MRDVRYPLLLHMRAAKIDVECLVLRLMVFSMDGFVNNKKWRVWGTEKLNVAVSLSLHP